MLNILSDKLKVELTSISLLENVYDFFVIQNEWFPYASFELNDFDGEYLDSYENKRFWTFKIAIFQETSKMTRDEAKKSLYDVLEKIIEKFDWNQFLDWLVNNSKVVKWNLWNYTSDKWWKMLFLDINIQFETTLKINN